MSDVLQELQMAELSITKVQDVESLMTEASELMTDISVASETRQKVEAAIETIKNTSDHEFTPAFVRDIDNLINTRGGVVVDKDGDVKPIVTGTESFGFTLTPKEFRATRVAGLENLAEDLFRNIKRWANQLEESFRRRAIEFKASVETLEERIHEATLRIDYLDKISEGRDMFTIPAKVVETFSKGNEFIKRELDKGIEKEFNYLFAQLAFWTKEQQRYRNSISRHFGSYEGKILAKEVYRLPLFKTSRKANEVYGDIETGMQYQATDILLGNYRIEEKLISQQGRAAFYDPSKASAYADLLGECGFTMVKTQKANATDVTSKTLSVSQLYALRDLVNRIIALTKAFYAEDPETDMDPDDVKSFMVWLKKECDDKDIIYQYGTLSADYQFEVSKFKTSVIGYLTIMASHLITLMNISMECYDVRAD